MNSLISYLLRIIFACVPETRWFAFKRSILRARRFDVGENVRACSSAKFLITGDLTIGEGTWLGNDVLIAGGGATIVIGARCDIAPRVVVATGTHEILIGEDRAAGPGYSEPISIGDGCWIGAGVIILGGTDIGECCIVAAGAVVKGRFPPRSLIGGVPAKVIRTLDA